MKKKTSKKIPIPPVSKGKNTTNKQCSITPNKDKTIGNIEETPNLPAKVTYTIDKKDTGAPDKYNPTVAKNIVEQIAIDASKDIQQICKDNGIDETTLHKWKLYINEFAQALTRARESRAEAEVDSVTMRLKKLTTLVEDDDTLDAKTKHVHVQLFHRYMQHHHWLAGKHNDKYRDTPGIQINIDAGGMRASAWDRRQERK